MYLTRPVCVILLKQASGQSPIRHSVRRWVPLTYPGYGQRYQYCPLAQSIHHIVFSGWICRIPQQLWDKLYWSSFVSLPMTIAVDSSWSLQKSPILFVLWFVIISQDESLEIGQRNQIFFLPYPVSETWAWGCICFLRSSFFQSSAFLEFRFARESGVVTRRKCSATAPDTISGKSLSIFLPLALIFLR